MYPLVQNTPKEDGGGAKKHKLEEGWIKVAEELTKNQMDTNAHKHVTIGDILSTLTVSIGHCSGVARGAWKHAPIILKP